MTTETRLPVLAPLDTFQEWQKQEGIPIFNGFFVQDLATIEVGPWERTGGLGVFVNLEGAGGTNNAYVAEIPPGGSLKPQRHMYEEMVYVLKGRGATTVSGPNGEQHTFEWGAGSLFSVPLNAPYQHHNGSGTEPARYLAVTNASVIMNLFHNLRFVFENPFVFDDRMLDPEHFRGEGRIYRNRRDTYNVWETNFVPDARQFGLFRRENRGAGGSYVAFELAQNTMAAHISEFPVGTYKKCHRHGPGANVVILKGEGFSILWPRGKPEERVKVDWQPGSIIAPPSDWYHQHFNVGTEPARYLALRWGSARFRLESTAFGGNQREGSTDTSESEGGAQIEYRDEDPDIHRMFETELANHGAPCRMKALVPWCTGVSE